MWFYSYYIYAWTKTYEVRPNNLGEEVAQKHNYIFVCTRHHIHIKKRVNMWSVNIEIFPFATCSRILKIKDLDA